MAIMLLNVIAQIQTLEIIDLIELEDPTIIIISDHEDDTGAIDIDGILTIDLINIIK